MDLYLLCLYHLGDCLFLGFSPPELATCASSAKRLFNQLIHPRILWGSKHPPFRAFRGRSNWPATAGGCVAKDFFHIELQLIQTWGSKTWNSNLKLAVLLVRHLLPSFRSSSGWNLMKVANLDQSAGRCQLSRLPSDSQCHELHHYVYSLPVGRYWIYLFTYPPKKGMLIPCFKIVVCHIWQYTITYNIPVRRSPTDCWSESVLTTKAHRDHTYV